MNQLTRAAVHEAILEANETLMSKYSNGDAAGIAELYTEDGRIMPPNSDSAAGRGAVQAFWQGLMDMGIGEIRLEEGDVEGCDDTAYEVSTYKLIGQDGQTLDRGKYIVIWKEMDGEWMLHRDIFNSNMPAPTD